MAQEHAVREGIYKAVKEGNLDGLRDYYEAVAQEYDQYSAAATRELGAQAVTNVVVNAVPDKNARILDACAGTGLAGIQLKQSGFTNIDALDFSQKMLDVAKDRGIYQNYICDGIKTDGKSKVLDNTYDVVVVNVGFALGHLNVNHIPVVVRMVKKGGIIAFNVSEKDYQYPEFTEDYFKTKLDGFISQGLFSKWEKHNYPYNDHENCNLYLLCLQ